jgi:very-short-patch-repair endonuclease
LFFSRTRASTLRIVGPGLREIFDHLVNEEKFWRFLIPSDDEGAEESENDSGIPEARPDADLALEYPEAHGDRWPWSRPSPRHADELLTDIENGVDLRRILRNLHRRSRTDFEERGVRILFITFGVLKWKEVEQSETVTSPVLLVPVELKRESVNDPFQLWPVDEDMVINPALAVKLANDFNIQLPAVPEDWDALTVVEFLAAFEEQTRKYDWSVEQECWLGLFSFHKLVIYHDLETHAQLLDAHSIVRCLCEEERTPTSEDPPEPRELDQETGPQTSFLVADADSSQLVCIEAVKTGSNLVIQGPPGTGKSQTITNLVAEFIARGKSVLFVSEKMAALEVVFQRLLNANLGHFCLQLHSHRANKRHVIQELYRTHLEQLQPKRGLTEYEARQLVERRKKLNEYVHSLHLVRRPVGHSAYEGLGWLAELADIPYVPAGLFDASTMTPETLDSAEQFSYRLIPVWGVALAGVEFPWFGCSLNAFTLENKAKLQATLSESLESLGVLAATMSETGRRLGLEGLPTVSGAEWFLEAGRLLKQCPRIEKHWIVGSDLEALVSEAAKYRDLSKIYQDHRSALTSRYKTDFLSLPNDLRDDIKGSVEELSSYLRQPLLVEDDSAFVASRSTLLEWAHDLEARLENWIQDGEALQRILGLQGALSVRRLRQLIRIAHLCQSENRPDESWFDVLKLREVLQFLPGIRDAFKRRNGERRSLLTVYEPGILELDAKALIEKLAGPYSSFFRIFRPGYYKARGQINGLRKDGQLPHSILSDLRRVQSFKDLERHLVEDFPRNKQLLGACFKGLETDFDRVTRAVSVAQELVELAGIQPIPPKLIRGATSVQGIATPDLRSVAQRLEKSLADWEKRLSTVNSLLLSDPDGGAGLPFEETPLLDLKRWSRRFQDSLELFCNLIGRALSCAHSAEGFSCLRIIVDFDRLAQLRKIESQLSAETDHLKERYGTRFAGVSTAWGEIIEAIQWAARFMRHLGNRQVPDLLLSLIVAPREGVLDTDSLGHALNRVRGAFQQLSSNFHEGLPAVNGTPLLQSDYSGMATRLQQMLKQLDALRDWIDYKALEAEFHQQGLGELLANLVSKATLVRPEDVPKVVRRSLLQAWLNWVFAQDPSLGGFRGDNHERLIAEFQQLDRKHWEQGVHSVIREVSRHRPVASVVIPGGELQILFKEANKQRRHLPLRKLFGLIPNLLTQLKPCLLMSPISVSQFLDPEKTKFDLVIFDEASQLRSEDAVCSVYRGKQLVVCGDNKQLPPTTFFEQGMSDELLDEADDASAMEAFDVFGSILDACATVMPQRQLKWHYRSEHESLIAFSNCTFYDYSLVTFPSWLEEDDGLGVKFVHVPDGVYDRGGRRDNVQEAEKVVSLVEEHFRRFPKQSLGVVTFNIAQADTIENLLEQFRRQNPELERYFGDDHLEKFFVKNLESVQGDERDVLIFSVGYGRDKFGRLTMNFGPLNSSGGERRLNVAVTRARKKVIVVSSITASDFDLGEIRAEGVRVFQRYLDFAENGPQALETKLAVSEFESPLEQSVAATIRTFGFDVTPQVGCSSFRVDLGIVDPAQPGRFVLGVECDGALYHSSAAARDRDRIRQQVLERLGWRIHRIWSPDWVTRRETEVGRLRAAIEAARSAGSRSISGDPPQSSNGPVMIQPLVIIEKNPTQINDKWVIPEWVVKYRVSKPRVSMAHGLQFHDPSALPLLKGMLSQIVEVEGPIHKEVAARRLARAWEFERVGDRMMTAVKSAWRSLHRDGLLNIQGAFLWPANPTFQLAVRQPDPDDEEAWRPINEIPPEEIVLAMTSLVRNSLSLGSDTLLLYVARIFGFERTGTHIQKALEDTFDELVETGQLALKDGRVSLPN